MSAPPWNPPGPDTPVAEVVIGVRTSELDSFGHVNHAVYLNYFEHARFEALAEAGFRWSTLAERGWAIFVVRIEVDYLAEAGREDHLRIRTWADSFRRTSMILAQEMVRDDDPDTVVARARVTAVWIGPKRKPIRVPPDVRAGLGGASDTDASPPRFPIPHPSLPGVLVNPRERLADLLVSRSVKIGTFTLASGATSDYYVDARRTTMTAEGQLLVGQVAYEAIREAGLDPSHVGGLTLGADPVAYAIAHRSALEDRPIDAFTVRKRAKDHGTGQRIEGGLPARGRALMVEDTMTTGRSTLEAVEAVRAHGSAIVGVLTLVDRSEGAADFYENQGLPLIALFSGGELLERARAGGSSVQEP